MGQGPLSSRTGDCLKVRVGVLVRGEESVSRSRKATSPKPGDEFGQRSSSTGLGLGLGGVGGYIGLEVTVKVLILAFRSSALSVTVG